jgi:hypothetical protein
MHELTVAPLKCHGVLQVARADGKGGGGLLGRRSSGRCDCLAAAVVIKQAPDSITVVRVGLIGGTLYIDHRRCVQIHRR